MLTTIIQQYPFVDAFEAENPPIHLLLGSDALNLVREKLDFLKSEFDAWEKLTLSTDVSFT
jgi:hypothetical protein